MIKANVILDYSKWKNKIKDPNNYLKKKLRKLSKVPYFKRKKQEFSILLTNNEKMKNLNLKFRKKNKPTDVLSFRLKEKNYIGDIAISFEKVKDQVLNDFMLRRNAELYENDILKIRNKYELIFQD